MTEQKKTPRVKKNRIFISWSGDNSKKIATELKNVLENNIFNSAQLECFVSTVDIASGDDWWNKIKKELKSCKQGILCITKENIKSPWIYFEAGAMVAREVKTIPLLVNCGVKSLENSPVIGKQCVYFYDQNQFLKMIYDINDNMKLLTLEKKQLDMISKGAYEELKATLMPTLKILKQNRLFNEKYIYPSNVTTVVLNSLYISVPMSSVDNDYYIKLREQVLHLREVLNELGFINIYCPIFDIENPEKFDGKTKAIKENFANMKRVDCMMMIYPKEVPSSVLVEVGYAIALSKKTVIFYNDRLPYLLEDAGENINHVRSYKYKNIKDIENIIKKNGMDIFDGGNVD